MIRFDHALPMVARILAGHVWPEGTGKPLVIRDTRGRISIALKWGQDDHRAVTDSLRADLSSLGAFAAPAPILFAPEFFAPDLIFNDSSITEFRSVESDESIRLLDRMITGQDWLLTAEADFAGAPRLAFYGLKGGVGRSTALAILAFDLARRGKRVLVMDLDWESPGLSGLLLPTERRPEFGIVDWLVEDAAGQGDSVRQRMLSASPIANNEAGEILVAPAIGLGDEFYLDKLSRAYADISEHGSLHRFSVRVARLVEELETGLHPDVILIDSRAGLHDLAAMSIAGLSTMTYCFSTDSAQAWQGYRALFRFWQQRPAVARVVRERLKIVRALFPESDPVARSRSFLEHSYQLFTDTLYDEIPSGSDSTEFFNFQADDSSAPHYPLRIQWNNRFQEFDPLQIPNGLFTPDEIRGSFGDFIDGVMQGLPETES